MTPPRIHRPDNIHVSEVFGPTLQGEGPFVGTPAVFLRLGGCNLTCSWCDTPYTWDSSRYDLRHEITAKPVAAVLDEIRACDPNDVVRLLVVTGGEPMLQQARLAPLVAAMMDYGWTVQTETNGTRPHEYLPDGVVHVISPKLPSSGVSGDRAWVDIDAWLREVPSIHVKFVIGSHADMEAARLLTEEHRTDPRVTVWVMPQGITRQEIAFNEGLVADFAIRMGWRYSPRLHVDLWGTRRGV